MKKSAFAVLLIAVLTALLLTRSSSAAAEDEDDGDLSSWEFARAMDGDQNLTVYTKALRGLLSFRFQGMVDSSVMQLMALCREADLMNEWLSFCTRANVTHVDTPSSVRAYAALKFWPMPIPPLFVVVHATLQHIKSSSTARRSDGGYWLCVLQTDPSYDRASLPEGILQRHSEVIIPRAAGRLSAIAPRKGSSMASRSKFDITLSIDMSKLSFLGPLRHLYPPAWMVRVLTSALVPAVWKAVVAVLGKLNKQGRGGPHGTRIFADETGMYAKMARQTGQPR